MAKQYDWSYLQSVGRRIALVRKREGLSQEALAEKTNLHRTYIGYIEQGKRDASIGTLEKIARALNISLPEILTLQVGEEESSYSSTKKK